MGTDGTTPDGTAGGNAAAKSASVSAGRAESAADDAAASAREAAEAAARAVVAAEIAPLVVEIAALKAANDKLVADELTDDEAATKTMQLVSSLQAQSLWISSGLILFGAAAGYIVERAFG